MSNLGFEKYLKNNLGIKLIRKDVGDINVILEMQKNKYSLGGEQSGHIILGQYLGTGDGILAALKVVELLSAQNLKASKLFDLYKSYPQIKNNIVYKKKITTKQESNINKISKKYKKKYDNYYF